MLAARQRHDLIGAQSGRRLAAHGFDQAAAAARGFVRFSDDDGIAFHDEFHLRIRQ